MLYGTLRHSVLIGRTSMSSTDGPITSFGMNVIKENMTEADTFNALRKSPFEVLYNEWVTMPDDSDSDTPIINKHGWTYNEFCDEYYKRHYVSR
jgi:hypothetical protein